MKRRRMAPLRCAIQAFTLRALNLSEDLGDVRVHDFEEFARLAEMGEAALALLDELPSEMCPRALNETKGAI